MATRGKKSASKKPSKKTGAKKVAAKKSLKSRAASKSAAPKKKTSRKTAGKSAGKKAAKKTARKANSKVVAKNTPADKIASVRKSSKSATKGMKSSKRKPLDDTSACGKIAVSTQEADPVFLEKEGFMNDRQKDYFRRKLLSWKEDILRESRDTLLALQTENENHPDFADRASSETDRAIELRARDRQRKLISKIDSALSRIEDGTYGYCEETGEPIALKRLDARPIATLSIEAQERHERRERVYRDD